MDEDPTLHCYELLSMQYLEQSQDDPLWARLHQWSTSQNKSQDAVQVIVNLPKELWFIAILLRENPKRLAAFMLSRRSLISEEEDLLVNYLQSFKLTELYLDTIFRFNPGGAATTTGQLNNEAELTVTTAQQHQHMTFRPPLAIFRCCPNVKILSLKNNNLETLPPDIGRLNQLTKLYLTNNRLQNGAIPYTLAFCSKLEELYLDDNLLDALPSVLQRMPSLKTVHRHGNHNYFKSTFMWYHTDVTGRILATHPNEQAEQQPPQLQEQADLQYLAAKTIIASRINFYSAEIPSRLKNYISDLCIHVNLCEAEDCTTVKNVSKPGYKVFTFRNPYLGNTCVPFLHWACDYDCARDIEIPARRQQILAAIEQDKMYENYVRESVDLLPPGPSRSLIDVSIQANPVVSASAHRLNQHQSLAEESAAEQTRTAAAAAVESSSYQSCEIL